MGRPWCRLPSSLRDEAGARRVARNACTGQPRATQRLPVLGARGRLATGPDHANAPGSSHQFTFEQGKIKKLRVLTSGKATESRVERLSLEGLKVEDVGRLSLAAWAVV